MSQSLGFCQSRFLLRKKRKQEAGSFFPFLAFGQKGLLGAHFVPKGAFGPFEPKRPLGKGLFGFVHFALFWPTSVGFLGFLGIADCTFVTPEPRRLFWQEAKNPRLPTPFAPDSQKPQTGVGFWVLGGAFGGFWRKRGRGSGVKLKNFFRRVGAQNGPKLAIFGQKVSGGGWFLTSFHWTLFGQKSVDPRLTPQKPPRGGEDFLVKI